MLEGNGYIVVDETDPSAALHALSGRIDQLARERNRDDLMAAALVMVALGVLIIAMRE